MDPTVEFFAKLKKLAATVESETDRLQQAFESRNSEDDAGERPPHSPSWAPRGPKGPQGAQGVPALQYEFLISDKSSRAMRAYHDVNGDISNLKVTFTVHVDHPAGGD